MILFIFNDTIGGSRAPAVKPGRVILAWRELGCSPVSGGKTIRLCSCWPSYDRNQTMPTCTVCEYLTVSPKVFKERDEFGSKGTRRDGLSQGYRWCFAWLEDIYSPKLHQQEIWPSSTTSQRVVVSKRAINTSEQNRSLNFGQQLGLGFKVSGFGFRV